MFDGIRLEVTRRYKREVIHENQWTICPVLLIGCRCGPICHGTTECRFFASSWFEGWFGLVLSSGQSNYNLGYGLDGEV